MCASPRLSGFATAWSATRAGPARTASPRRASRRGSRAGDAAHEERLAEARFELGFCEQFLPKKLDAAATILEKVWPEGRRLKPREVVAEFSKYLRDELDRTRKRISHLERVADEDAMLPIANRRAFVRELTRLISFSERYGSPGSVLYFDLNGMKQINDRFGHPAGDAALRHFATLLVNNVRDSDVVGRLGGDEFGVILAQADKVQAQEKANQLLSVIARSPLVWEGIDIEMSCAVGIHEFHGQQTADDALSLADASMYQAKRQHYAVKSGPPRTGGDADDRRWVGRTAGR